MIPFGPKSVDNEQMKIIHSRKSLIKIWIALSVGYDMEMGAAMVNIDDLNNTSHVRSEYILGLIICLDFMYGFVCSGGHVWSLV